MYRLVTVAASALGAACSGAEPTGPQGPPSPHPPGTPAALAVAAGNAQTAVAGSALPTAPRVRVSDLAGAGVAGFTVQFQVTAGGGSVEHPSAATDAEGVASAGDWILGSAGEQQLRATAPGLAAVVFSATATAVPAAISPLAGDGQTAEVGRPVPVAPEVRVTDAAGAPVPGIGVTFAVTGGGGVVTGAVATTDAEGRARVGSWTMGTNAGPNTLSASAAESAIAGEQVTFSALAVPGQPTAVTPTQGDGQTAPGGSPVPIRPQVRVTDAHGNGVSGLAVTFSVTGGGGSVSGPDQTTGPDGRATVGSWILGSAAGPNSLTASVSAAGVVGNPVTFGATATTTGSSGAGSYDIEIRYNAGTSPTSAQAAAFAQAESRWEAVITGDLVDTPVNRPAGTCSSSAPINETVDDLVIFVTFEAIDGAGGVLGNAGPCLIRSGSLLSLVGQMKLDVADLATMEATGALDDVILHELGHVIGVGSLWSAKGLLADASLSGGTDPHFTGGGATSAFNGVGGSGYAGAKVPVEDTGGSGTADSHWRESVFDAELMTGWVDVGSNPLSIVTVESLADMGYGVDAAQADSFGLPASSLVVPGRGPGAPMLHLVGDVVLVPLEIVAPDGASVGLIPR